mmetsp:Transcript_25308/g.95578  ORF Transcript_25308/g.95578 Transcript_25308/m.95578 type:complete len:270 (+) Transcript_25308:348-1157(+)
MRFTTSIDSRVIGIFTRAERKSSDCAEPRTSFRLCTATMAFRWTSKGRFAGDKPLSNTAGGLASSSALMRATSPSWRVSASALVMRALTSFAASAEPPMPASQRSGGISTGSSQASSSAAEPTRGGGGRAKTGARPARPNRVSAPSAAGVGRSSAAAAMRAGGTRAMPPRRSAAGSVTDLEGRGPAGPADPERDSPALAALAASWLAMRPRAAATVSADSAPASVPSARTLSPGTSGRRRDAATDAGWREGSASTESGVSGAEEAASAA